MKESPVFLTPHPLSGPLCFREGAVTWGQERREPGKARLRWCVARVLCVCTWAHWRLALQEHPVAHGCSAAVPKGRSPAEPPARAVKAGAPGPNLPWPTGGTSLFPEKAGDLPRLVPIKIHPTQFQMPCSTGLGGAPWWWRPLPSWPCRPPLGGHTPENLASELEAEPCLITVALRCGGRSTQYSTDQVTVLPAIFLPFHPVPAPQHTHTHRAPQSPGFQAERIIGYKVRC